VPDYFWSTRFTNGKAPPMRPVFTMQAFIFQLPTGTALNHFVLMMLLISASMCSGCSFREGFRLRESGSSTHLSESVEYLRAFSRDQEECIKAMSESSPNWGAHKEALDYGDFLEEKAPRLLQIIEEQLPKAQRAMFQRERADVEARVRAAEQRNESEALEMEGGTLARTIRHNGTKIPMKIRISSISPWIPHLPLPLQREIQEICERTAKH
jgi:hypothetical protein